MSAEADRERWRVLLEKSTYHHFRETQAHQEVGGPVGETGDSYGGGSRPLGEEFGHNEPGNGAWTHLKAGNKAEHSDDGQVAQGLVGLLLQNKQNEDVRRQPEGISREYRRAPDFDSPRI